jgi:hypothetical protein
MRQYQFKDSNNDLNLVDTAGNHFINGKCVNPKATLDDNREIGDTYLVTDGTPETLAGEAVVGHIESPVKYQEENSKVWRTINPTR